MSSEAWVATRKGLFKVAGSDSDWKIVGRPFVGDNVSIVADDGETDALYASLDHGHFGTKLHRSDNDGENWTEITCPELS
jgi:hypothetical protein